MWLPAIIYSANKDYAVYKATISARTKMDRTIFLTNVLNAYKK